MSTCDLCNYSTTRNNNYIRHMSSKKHLKMVANGKLAGDNIKKFHCEYCDIYFKDRYDAKRHDKTDKHLKQRAARWQAQKPAEATPQEKHKIKRDIEFAAYKKTYVHKDRKIINRKIIDKKVDKIIFNPEDYKDYNYLDHNQMTKLIKIFVDYIKSKKVDIENYINYEYWENDPNEDETENLYIELYELLQDADQLTEINNL